MTLAEFLPSVAHNPKLYLKIYESDNTHLITFDAASYLAINDTLSAREIDKITIAEEQDVVKIILKPLPEPTPDPEPEGPTNIPLDPDQLSGSVIGG